VHSSTICWVLVSCHIRALWRASPVRESHAIVVSLWFVIPIAADIWTDHQWLHIRSDLCQTFYFGHVTIIICELGLNRFHTLSDCRKQYLWIDFSPSTRCFRLGRNKAPRICLEQACQHANVKMIYLIFDCFDYSWNDRILPVSWCL